VKRAGPPIAPEFEQHLAVDFPEDPSMVPGNYRRLRDAMAAGFDSDEAVLALADVQLTHLDAAGVPVIRIVPAGLAGTAPAVFSVHGGGLVAGGHRSGLAALALLAQDLGVIVLTPDYRLAPEYPYPAASDDCWAAITWSVEHADELGIDPRRLVLVGGSAGGAISGGLALRLRDAGGPELAALMLIQPQLDDRNQLPSTFELDDDIIWDRTSNLTAWSLYLGEGVDAPAYAAPARAESLAGLPPTFIEIGSSDLFRDECLAFAARASHDRVPVELHLWPGAFHGFDAVAGSAIAAAALAARRNYLVRALGL